MVSQCHLKSVSEEIEKGLSNAKKKQPISNS